MKWLTLVQVVAYAVRDKPDEFHNARAIIPANAIVKITEMLEVDEDDKLFYDSGARTEFKLADDSTIVVKETIDDIYKMLKELGD